MVERGRRFLAAEGGLRQGRLAARLGRLPGQRRRSPTRPSSGSPTRSRPGQTGCLRAGVYQRDVKVTKGGAPSAPDHDHELPRRARHRCRPPARRRRGEQRRRPAARPRRPQRATTCRARPSTATTWRSATTTSPTTTRRSASSSASDEYGRARGTVIERNRIHNCGQLPPTNHHHGIYVEASDGARITDNWIYDNADRGMQLFPDAQGTYIARNVIDGNGAGRRLLARRPRTTSSRTTSSPTRWSATTSRTGS